MSCLVWFALPRLVLVVTRLFFLLSCLVFASLNCWVLKCLVTAAGGELCDDLQHAALYLFDSGMSHFMQVNGKSSSIALGRQ